MSYKNYMRGLYTMTCLLVWPEAVHDVQLNPRILILIMSFCMTLAPPKYIKNCMADGSFSRLPSPSCCPFILNPFWCFSEDKHIFM